MLSFTIEFLNRLKFKKINDLVNKYFLDVEECKRIFDNKKPHEPLTNDELCIVNDIFNKLSSSIKTLIYKYNYGFQFKCDDFQTYDGYRISYYLMYADHHYLVREMLKESVNTNHSLGNIFNISDLNTKLKILIVSANTIGYEIKNRNETK